MKIIHVTDTHLLKEGESLHGLDPQQRMRQCMHSIKQHHADAHCMIVTGDLVDRGEPEAYDLFKQEIASTGLPTYTLLGNHDNRNNYREGFPQAQFDSQGFAQSVVETPAGVFLLLDTLETGTHSGVYCPKRQQWLQEQLNAYQHSPVFLFMHHPPFDLHLPCIDKIGLVEKKVFSDIVSSHKQIRHLFFGHAHRALCGHWQGISFSSLRGTNHQVKLDFKSPKIHYSHEDPEYAVVFIDEDQVVVHTHNYFSE